jgi:hypothetical protein
LPQQLLTVILNKKAMNNFKYDKVIHQSTDYEAVADLVANWANEILDKKEIKIEIISSNILHIPDETTINKLVYVSYTLYKWENTGNVRH